MRKENHLHLILSKKFMWIQEIGGN
ncbi:hypothetical protein Golob_018459 [Gossypium lobatum]|uniref:Uncharacterized protein n=1 Tax=Gossypium lobatum TaxID=34289 RepID=A0A7J8MAA0_9ROSI|nr:hypothetical protein [Gossypium lobatum]